MAKPPSWNEIRERAQAFVPRWEDEISEVSSKQPFWIEFFAIFGVDRKRVATFELRAKKASTGRGGSIDLFFPAVAVIEHKSAGESLDKAEQQAIDYLGSVTPAEFPQYVITSDFAHFRIRDLSGENEPFTFPIQDLPKEIDRFGFIAGYQKRTFTSEEEEQANITAAKLMGRLYEELSANGYEGHETTVLMTRLLFILFGDDTGMWEKGLFTEFIETRTSADGSDLGSQLASLFQTLNKPIDKRSTSLDELLCRFPYINGGLFSDRIDIPSFNTQMRNELLECCAFDWGDISPAIFGSLFTALKSKEARRALGEHYTSERQILRVLEPLILDDLRKQYKEAFHSVLKLKRMRTKLAELRVMDPACGCGNFLVVAYRELRQLELDILIRLRELTKDESLSLYSTLGLSVSLDQFFGIEIEEWPARIAETAMFLVDHQANLKLGKEFGLAPDRLPLKISSTIILENAIEKDWETILPADENVYIVGNPPFIGMSLMSDEQHKDNKVAFQQINTFGIPTGRLDYVASWYAKAIHYMKGTAVRAAFVSTNSITQGEQARTLLPLLKQNDFEIDFAHQTFKWTSEAAGAAAVHVVIIGFSWQGQAKTKRLFQYPDITADPNELVVRNINFYLLDADDIAPEKRSTPLVAGLPNCTKGSQATDGGNLFVKVEDLSVARADPVVVKYLRRFIGSDEMLNGIDRWCLWLTEASPTEISSSKFLKARLNAVKQMRSKSPTTSVQAAASIPGIFTQIRQPSQKYLAMPKVSSENRPYIPAAFFEPDVIAGDAVLTFPGAPLWLFGYLQSKCFMVWVDAYSGRLESRYQILPGLVYFTFPFVLPTGAALTDIEDAAKNILEIREQHGSSLSDLYGANSMPRDLFNAHQELNKAIDALHGLRGRVSDGERLQALLARYVALTTTQKALPLEV